MSTEADPTPPDRIVISNEDLDTSIPVDRPAMTMPSLPRTVPPPAQGGLSYGVPPGSTAPQGVIAGYSNPAAPAAMTKLGSNSVVAGLFAGLAGGVAGMLIAELLYSSVVSPPNAIGFSSSEVAARVGVWVAIFGAVLGFALMGWDGLTSGSASKCFRDGAIGAGIGLAAGFVGGYLAQTLYHELLKDVSPFAPRSDFESKALIARVVAWAVFGALLGVGLGIPGGARKVVNGLIGGTVGAATGGLIFNRIEFSGNGSTSGFVLRLLGLTATGVGIGLAIGLVSRIRRDAWLLLTGGPMAGKEFILYGAQTTVGADYRSDIVLVKDSQVLPQHLVFLRSPDGSVALQAVPGAPVFVNGTPTQSQRLRSGDLINVGMSTLTYQERAVNR